MTGRATGQPTTETKENTVSTLPTSAQKRVARGVALRTANVAFVGLALLLTVAGAYYGPVWVLLEGLALILLAAATIRADYRDELDGQVRLAEQQVRLADFKAQCEQHDREWEAKRAKWDADDAERAARGRTVPRRA